MKLAEILSGPETWCQGCFRIGERQCLMTALAELVVREDTSHLGIEVRRMQRLLEAPPPLSEWNDAPGRTWEDIAQAVDDFDRARLLNP
jgi:hypothetical protein